MKMQIPKKTVRDISLPVLGLGTWQMGGRYEPDFSRDREEIDFVKTAYELGIRHFDTAESYAAGHSEELLGRALRTLPRGQVFVTSKVSDTHLGYNDVLDACRKSLKRLGTEYLDLYLVHAPSTTGAPIKETLSGMAELIKQGLVRHIGVSNFDVKRLRDALQAGSVPIVCNQIHLSVAARDYLDDGTVDFCQRKKILVVAYRPLGLGGRTRGSLPDTGWQILERVGKKYRKSAVQVALAWVLQQPGVVTLVRTMSAVHLTENLGAVGFRLENEDVEFLDAFFPRIPTMRPIPSQRA